MPQLPAAHPLGGFHPGVDGTSQDPCMIRPPHLPSTHTGPGAGRRGLCPRSLPQRRGAARPRCRARALLRPCRAPGRSHRAAGAGGLHRRPSRRVGGHGGGGEHRVAHPRLPLAGGRLQHRLQAHDAPAVHGQRGGTRALLGALLRRLVSLCGRAPQCRARRAGRAAAPRLAGRHPHPERRPPASQGRERGGAGAAWHHPRRAVHGVRRRHAASADAGPPGAAEP